MTCCTMTKAHDTRHDVRQGKRLIGFISFVTLHGVGHWRFIANRQDIAARYPAPSPTFDTAAETLADINAKLGSN